MEWSDAERAAKLRLYQEHCEEMARVFEYYVFSGELSRLPTAAEMAKVRPILLQKIMNGEWGDSDQELVAILCAVAPVTSTMLP